MVAGQSGIRMKGHHPRVVLLGLAWMTLLLSAPCLAGQGIQPTVENGRTVWTNDTPTPHKAKALPLYYWDTAEKKWLPVKATSEGALRSARAVAGEVNNYIESQPKLGEEKPSTHGLADNNPNYAKAAAGRKVSSEDIDRFIQEAAARHKVNPNLVRALVQVESNYNPNAVSRKGAMGLMQLMPATAHQYDVNNPFDVRQNVEAGVRHLKGLLDNFGGNVPLSLAAYNAGKGAVERNGGIPPYSETQNYVKRITHLMGAGPLDAHLSNLSQPVLVHRDERGRLFITNTE